LLFILSPNQSIEKVQELVDEEINRVQNDLVGTDEIERAVTQAKAMFVYGSENITNQAFWMGFASMFADHTWFDSYISNLEAVSREAIRTAAREYLDPSRRVIGAFIPGSAGGQ
jgi:zinc protease